MLTQLIYSSRTTRTLTSVDLISITSTSQQNNLLAGITGALCYDRGSFLQLIEGEHSVIAHLYPLLLQDERHSELKILDLKEITERRFANWSMGFFNHENEISQLFLKHTKMAEFAPFSISALDANKFFDEVKKHVTLPKQKSE